MTCVCKNCGAYSEGSAAFCANCGMKLETETAPVQTMNEPNPQSTQNTLYQQNPQYAPNPQNPNYYGAYQPRQENGKGMAIASFVLGLSSLLIVPIVTGILAVVFGCVARSKGSKDGMATAGIVCGVIGVVLWCILIFVGISFFTAFLEAMTKYM